MNQLGRAGMLLLIALAAVLPMVSPLPLRGAEARRLGLALNSLDQLIRPAFVQPRLQVDERIVPDPYIHQEFRIRWVAPDRLRTDVYGTNLHVGKVGCVLGNFWVCGLDSAQHLPELRQATMYALFPQHGNNGYCCLYNLQVQAAASPNSYILTAIGDPWIYPLGCQGCGTPGSIRRPISSEHYRATLTLDANRRPNRLTSTITFDPVTTSKGKLPGGKTRAQIVTFNYSGAWTVDLPQGKRLLCPSWDQTSGSWCVRNK